MAVAPYVGAWIETFLIVVLIGRLLVAPYVGAWIETAFPYHDGQADKSHPTWVRGLKLTQK